MTLCTQQKLIFPDIKRRKVEVNFEGGDISSDGGSLLLRQVENKIKLLFRIAPHLPDNRDQSKVEHSSLELLKQRVFGLALGYEDLNDHDNLRHDLLLQSSIEKDKDAGSSATLCRFENRADRKIAIKMHEIMFKIFIESFDKPPEEIILDFDATDDEIHGNQIGKKFHGYYGHYCFLPLYVYCGSHLLVSYLRKSNIDGAKHSWAILRLLVNNIRKAWPEVKIIFRGDGGFCRHKMFNWCEKHQVYYITGLTSNKVLHRRSFKTYKKSAKKYKVSNENQKCFSTFRYGAKSWKKKRKVIVKAEYNGHGSNIRYIVTNLPGTAEDLYKKTYCARGNMENSIKMVQSQLFADRTSCHDWDPNQFRLILSSLAYILMDTIRRIALQKTQFAKAEINTLRLKLFKIGAVVIRNTRRIKVLLSSSYPYQHVFNTVAQSFAPG